LIFHCSLDADSDYNDAASHVTIRDGTDAIGQASPELSERMERQADALARAAKSLRNVTDSMHISADNAQHTNARFKIVLSLTWELF
jgi:methyl-accepting chemotaxis protein